MPDQATEAPMFKPGIYPGLSRDDYYDMRGVTQSRLKPFLRSAAHGRFEMLHPSAPSASMELGTALHKAVLEPARFAGDYVVAPKCDKRTKAGKEEWAAFEALNSTKSLMDADEMDAVSGMARALHSHPLAGELLKGEGLNEIAATWIDGETGLACKGLIDRLTRFMGQNLVLDVKSTRDAQPPNDDDSACAFASDALRFGYVFQAAFYLDGLNAIQPAERGFWVLAVESEPPHGVAVYELPEETIAHGRAQYQLALRRYAEAKKSDSWPGYSCAKHLLNLPKWARGTA